MEVVGVSVEHQIISSYSVCPPSSLKYASINSQVAFLIVKRYEMVKVISPE